MFVGILAEYYAGNIGRDGGTMRGSASQARSLVKLLAQLTPSICRPVDGQHPVSNFSRLHHVFRPHGCNINGDLRTWRSETHFEATLEVEHFAMIDQFLAAQDHANDLYI